MSPRQAHKKQVEITQEGLQEAKQKYSLALKNLEGISEEIHEMRKSRDSLDTILHEREEGVGAESPVGDLSRDNIRSETEFNCKELGGLSDQLNKPSYGFKIALVSASSQAQAGNDEAESGVPVGERDGDPEGCSSVDEQQLNVATRHEDLSKKEESESDSVNYQGQNNSATLNDGTEAIDTQDAPLFDENPQHIAQHIAQQATDPVSKVAADEVCSTTKTGLTNQQLVPGERENLKSVLGRDSHVCEAVETHKSANMTESQEQRNSRDTTNENELESLVEDRTNETLDNYETCNVSVQEEIKASETATELQSEVSIVPVVDDTADEEATRTIVDTVESDSMEEAAKQLVLNKDTAYGSGELLEQESSDEFLATE